MARKPVAPALSLPLVALTTDFGTRDFYVAAMKAAILRHCPNCRLIDVTHEIPPHDILCGSITLERAIDGFLPGTIHLAVIDPGVGSNRRVLVVRINEQTVICPDNGLITWAVRRLPPAKISELTWRPDGPVSSTFHGRDIMAPAVGMLACGAKITDLAKPIDDPILLDISPAAANARQARVIHIDHFGNATTNVGHEAMHQFSDRVIRIRNKAIGKLRRTYWDVAPGKALALIGSSGLLEIAVRDGSAAKSLRLKVGDEIRID